MTSPCYTVDGRRLQDRPEGFGGEALGQFLDRQAELLREHDFSILPLGTLRQVGRVRVARLLGVDDLDVVLPARDGELLEWRGLLLGGVVDAKKGRGREDAVQRLDLLEDRRELIRRVHTKPEDVPTRARAGLDDEGGPKLGVAHTDGAHLQVGDGDVEVLRQARMPDQPHVRDEERPEVALIRRQVPHAVDAVVELLVGQHDEPLVLDDGTAQLEVAEEAARVVRAVDRLDGREQPWALPHQACEDELEARVVVLGHHVQCLRAAAKTRVGLADVDREHGIVPDRQVDARIPVADPYQPQVGDGQRALLAVVACGRSGIAAAATGRRARTDLGQHGGRARARASRTRESARAAQPTLAAQ